MKKVEPKWQIGKRKKITVSEFKGRTLVNIREYYNDNGEEKPGKKGICLQTDEFLELVKYVPEIKEHLQSLSLKKFN